MSGGNGVESIVFTAADINVARNTHARALSFDLGNTAARLRYEDLKAADVRATLGGMFLGKITDVPLAVIGSWSLHNSHGDNLTGAYGADLVP